MAAPALAWRWVEIPPSRGPLKAVGYLHGQRQVKPIPHVQPERQVDRGEQPTLCWQLAASERPPGRCAPVAHAARSRCSAYLRSRPAVRVVVAERRVLCRSGWAATSGWQPSARSCRDLVIPHPFPDLWSGRRQCRPRPNPTPLSGRVRRTHRPAPNWSSESRGGRTRRTPERRGAHDPCVAKTFSHGLFVATPGGAGVQARFTTG
jgi:hypothetical protein